MSDGWSFPAPTDARINWRRIAAVAAIVAAWCIVWSVVAWWNLSTDVHAGRGPARVTLALRVNAQSQLNARVARVRPIVVRAKPSTYRSTQQTWATWSFDVSASERRHARSMRVSLDVVGALAGRLGSPQGATVRIATRHARVSRDKQGAWVVNRLGRNETVQVLVAAPNDGAAPVASAARLRTVTTPFDARVRRAAGQADDRMLLGNHAALWGLAAWLVGLIAPLLVWWRMSARWLVRPHRAGIAAESRARRSRETAGMPPTLPAVVAAQMTLGAVDIPEGAAVAATLMDLILADVARVRRVDSVGRSGGVQLSFPGDVRVLDQMQQAVIHLLLTADPDAARDVEHDVPVTKAAAGADAVDNPAPPDVELRSSCFLPDAGARLAHRLSRVSPSELMAARSRVLRAVRYGVSSQAGVRRVPRWMLVPVTRATIVAAALAVVGVVLFAPNGSASAYWVALAAAAVAGGGLIWTVPARRLIWWRWVARSKIEQRAAWVAWRSATSDRFDAQIPIDSRARGWAVGIGRSDAVSQRTINGAVGLDAITVPTVRACDAICHVDSPPVARHSR